MAKVLDIIFWVLIHDPLGTFILSLFLW